MNQLYKVIGISKQAVGQYEKRQLAFNADVHDLLLEAEELRKEHPGCGVEKMYDTLKPTFIGRDRFIDLFMDLGFRLKKKVNYKRTTYSTSFNYPNLIKGMMVNAPSMVWQSDITYIYVDQRFYYAVFIIDVFTKKIVGHQVSNHMRATANVKALQMALKKNRPPLIHHSDRGSQYTYKEYIEVLKGYQSKISMAISAQDNAYAERINRTIKEEYIDHWKPKNFGQLIRHVNKAVENYNTKRPHNNLGKITPECFEERWLNNELGSSQVLTIFDDRELIKTGQH